jgi:hypothetical protein
LDLDLVRIPDTANKNPNLYPQHWGTEIG